MEGMKGYSLILASILISSDAFMPYGTHMHHKLLRVVQGSSSDGDDFFDGLDVDIDGDGDGQELPPEIRARMISEGPSEADIRLEMMGITPLTKAGFALAGVILTLNFVLGTGWAADLFAGDAGTTQHQQEEKQQQLQQQRRQSLEPGSPFRDRSDMKTLTLDGKTYELQ